jgi:hypothetical protein
LAGFQLGRKCLSVFKPREQLQGWQTCYEKLLLEQAL